MANGIINIVFSLLILTKIIALLGFLINNVSFKLTSFWIPVEILDRLNCFSKEKQQKIKRIICSSLLIDIGISLLMIVIFPKDMTTVTLLLSLALYVNGIGLDKYARSMTEK